MHYILSCTFQLTTTEDNHDIVQKSLSKIQKMASVILTDFLLELQQPETQNIDNKLLIN